MKFFATLMAFLVLALSCMPCADESYSKETSAITVLKNSPADNNDHEDACSPFCQCTCCAGFSMHHPIESDAPLPSQYASHCSSNYTGSVIKVSLPVWQPPRV